MAPLALSGSTTNRSLQDLFVTVFKLKALRHWQPLVSLVTRNASLLGVSVTRDTDSLALAAPSLPAQVMHSL